MAKRRTSRAVTRTIAAIDQDIAGLARKEPGAISKARTFLHTLARTADADLLLYVFKAMAKWLGGRDV